MENTTIKAIMARKSVREYSDREIPPEAIRTILEAGMSGPSAVNARPWEFIAVTDPEVLAKMSENNGRAARPLQGAKLGILICGNLEKAFSRAPEYWIVDAAIAGQNMILAAESLGIGSVWLGTWPQEEKVANQKALFNLPEHIVPHSIIAFGYPKEEGENPVRNHWEEDRVHYNQW